MSIKECYFCDELYPSPSYFLHEKTNDIFACYYCEMRIPINVLKEGECCICSNKNVLIQLPNCLHTACVDCAKTTFFGSSKQKRPTHWREIMVLCPEWPYDEERDQIKEYFDNYDSKYFRTKTNSYEELLVVNTNPSRMDEHDRIYKLRK
jgi:hypothetical protein